MFKYRIFLEEGRKANPLFLIHELIFYTFIGMYFVYFTHYKIDDYHNKG